MQRLYKHIPNFITILNLLSGFFGIYILLSFQFQYNIEFDKTGYTIALACIVIASIFDLLDGLFARLLNAQSKIGKDLDSLADLVSFGVLPSLLLINSYNTINYESIKPISIIYIGQFIPFLIPVGAALRLAKFNHDENQTTNFRGLPTPAVGLLSAAILFYIYQVEQISIHDMNYEKNPVLFFYEVYTHPFFIPLFSIVLFLMMLSNISLISFKIKNFTLKKYLFHILFLSTSIISGLLIGFASAPILLILYIFFSQLYFRINKHEI